MTLNAQLHTILMQFFLLVALHDVKESVAQKLRPPVLHLFFTKGS